MIRCLEGNRAHGPAVGVKQKQFVHSGVFFLLLALVFTVSMGYGIVLPVLPAYLEGLPASAGRFSVPWHTGLLTGTYMLALFLFAPLWGCVSDRIGRRRVILLGLAGFVGAMLWFALARGVVSAYAARVLAGVCAAAVLPVVLAWVGDVGESRTRAQAFAWLSAAGALGFLFGPALGGWVASIESIGSPTALPLPFYATAALAGGMWLAAYLGLVDNPLRRAPEETSQPNAAPLLGLLALSLLVMFGIGSVEVGLALQGQQVLNLRPREIGWMFAECSLVMLSVNVALFWTRLLERAAGASVIAVGIALAVSGLAVLGQHRGIAPMYLGVSLTAAGTGLVLPTVAYLAAGASQRRLGRTMGGLTAAAGLGQTIGSAASGWLFSLVAQVSFTWLSLPLLATLGLLLARPDWWSRQADPRGVSRAS